MHTLQECNTNRISEVSFFVKGVQRSSLRNIYIRGRSDQRRGASDDFWPQPNTLSVRPVDWTADLLQLLIARKKGMVCLDLSTGAAAIRDFCISRNNNACLVSITYSDKCCQVESVVLP